MENSKNISLLTDEEFDMEIQLQKCDGTCLADCIRTTNSNGDWCSAFVNPFA